MANFDLRINGRTEKNRGGRSEHAAALCLARFAGAARPRNSGCGPGPMRRLHGDRGRHGGALPARCRCRARRDARSPRWKGWVRPKICTACKPPSSKNRAAQCGYLHQWHDHDGHRIAGQNAPNPPKPKCAPRWQANLCRCGSHVRVLARCDARSERVRESAMNQITIERRQFLQAGGGLFVSFALAGAFACVRTKRDAHEKISAPMPWIPTS